jgi:hypothetical protein
LFGFVKQQLDAKVATYTGKRGNLAIRKQKMIVGKSGINQKVKKRSGILFCQGKLSLQQRT